MRKKKINLLLVFMLINYWNVFQVTEKIVKRFNNNYLLYNNGIQNNC